MNYGYVKDEFSNLRFPKYGLNEDIVYEQIKEKRKKGLKLTKIESEIINMYFQLMMNVLKNERTYTSACILGSKTMFFTIDGDILGCEKTGRSFKIGDIWNGLDLERIAEIEKEWNKNTKRCKNCHIQAFCNACIATSGVNGKIVMDDFCNKLKDNFKDRVSEYIEFQKI